MNADEELWEILDEIERNSLLGWDDDEEERDAALLPAWMVVSELDKFEDLINRFESSMKDLETLLGGTMKIGKTLEPATGLFFHIENDFVSGNGVNCILSDETGNMYSMNFATWGVLLNQMAKVKFPINGQSIQLSKLVFEALLLDSHYHYTRIATYGEYGGYWLGYWYQQSVGYSIGFVHPAWGDCLK